MDYIEVYNSNKQQKLFGRYITLEDIEPILFELNTNNQLQTVGFSVQNNPIYSYTIGSGKTKVLIWSQMHGNESTTTKAIFDFLNVLQLDFGNHYENNFTFCIVPMLNPDGAKLYTRENANQIDLNRDFIDLTQPESNVLLKLFHDFKPDYCYNMHDQRTIYGVGETGKPATVSFLAPSFNENRDFNNNRTKAAYIISKMNLELQKHIPGQVGRFDDEFNPNCAGETFQMLGIPTILFESGHFQNDYDREITRKMIFVALLTSFDQINETDIVLLNTRDYLNIPQNNPCFFDFIFKNVKTNYDNSEITYTFAVQFIEELLENKIFFNAFIAKIDDLGSYFGHVEIDCKNSIYSDEFQNYPKLDSRANFYIKNHAFAENGVIKLI
jgi:Zinc carboxypeptidase